MNFSFLDPTTKINFENQLDRFPSSRYMGSKHSIWPSLYEVFNSLEFSSVLDAFSGSGAVSYLLKSMGKSVTSNDFLTFCYHTANASVANSVELINTEDIQFLLKKNPKAKNFISDNFKGLYFSDEDNVFLDNLTENIRNLKSPKKQSIAFSAISRACMRKRPRGVFTYIGNRYDDGRKDLQISLEVHFLKALELINASVFNNGQDNFSYNINVFDLPDSLHFDLVYIDTPYVSRYSDNDYTRRYHFVEGLTRYWKDLEILEKTETKKFRRLPSLFDRKSTVFDGFSKLFEKFKESKIVVSYSSNGIPSRDELIAILSGYKKNVSVRELEYRYSFGTHSHIIKNLQNNVKEYIFIGE